LIKKKGLIYKNKNLINLQKSLASKVMTQIVFNIFFNGKGIMNTTLPVAIFDKMSYL